MKKQFLYIFLVLMGLGSMVNAQIGFVSRAVVYQNIPGFMKDLKSIDSMQASFNREIQSQGEKLQEKARLLISSYNPKENETLDMIKKRMTASDTMTLKTIFDDNTALDNKGKSYDTRIEKLQKEKIEPVMIKIDNAIKEIAKADGLDAVYFFEDVSNDLAYINEKRNITERVIKALK